MERVLLHLRQLFGWFILLFDSGLICVVWYLQVGRLYSRGAVRTVAYNENTISC